MLQNVTRKTNYKTVIYLVFQNYKLTIEYQDMEFVRSFQHISKAIIIVEKI